jgi:hypothetical protein
MINPAILMSLTNLERTAKRRGRWLHRMVHDIRLCAAYLKEATPEMEREFISGVGVALRKGKGHVNFTEDEYAQFRKLMESVGWDITFYQVEEGQREKEKHNEADQAARIEAETPPPAEGNSETPKTGWWKPV